MHVVNNNESHIAEPGAATDRLAVRGGDAAAMCSVSIATWRRWDSGGLVPRGLAIGGAKLWLVQELRDWLRSGGPNRGDWESMRQI